MRLVDRSSEALNRRRARVAFSYQPQNEDELQLEVSDVIEVLEEVEEGWWKGVLKGRIGVFPSNFVVLEEPAPSSPRASRWPANSSDFHSDKPESSGDVTGDHSIASLEIKPKPIIKGAGFGNILPESRIKVKNQITDSSNDKRALAPLKKPAPPVPSDVASEAPKLPPKPVREQAKVLYAYEAQNDDELTIKEGDVITVLTKEVEDKGWWKGELNGRVGVFPDNFVKLIKEEVPQPVKPERPEKPPVGKMVGKPDLPDKPAFQEYGSDRPISKVPPFKPSEISKKEATFDSIEPSENKLNHPTANRVRPPMNRRPPSHITIVKENGNEPSEQQPAWMKDLGKRHQAKFSSQPTFETKDAKIASSPEKELPSRMYPQKSPPSVHKPMAGSVREDSAVLLRSPIAKETPAASAAPVILRNQKGLSSVDSDTVQELRNELKALRENCVPKEELSSLQQQINSLKETVESNRSQYSKLVRDLMAEIDEEKKLRMTLQVEIDRLKKLTLTV